MSHWNRVKLIPTQYKQNKFNKVFSLREWIVQTLSLITLNIENWFCHQQALMKRRIYWSNAKHKKHQVQLNRKYMKIIIKTLLFTAGKNKVQQKPEENCTDLSEICDINSGNILDFPSLVQGYYLDRKKVEKVRCAVDFVYRLKCNSWYSWGYLDSIANNVEKYSSSSVIVGMSNIIRVELVVMWLRFKTEGKTRRSFI